MAVWTGHARDTRPIPDQAGRPRGLARRSGRWRTIKSWGRTNAPRAPCRTGIREEYAEALCHCPRPQQETIGSFAARTAASGRWASPSRADPHERRVSTHPVGDQQLTRATIAAGQIVPDDAEIAEQTRRPRCEPEQSLCQCDLWHERDDCEPIKSSQVRAVSASLPADRRRGNAGDARVRAASVPVGFGKPIPTILITAYPDDAVRERGASAGPIGYLSKPLRRMICSLHPLGSDARP